MSERPDYITDAPDGSVQIALTDGKKITMREPTVEDQLAVAKGSDAEREITLVANLCDMAPTEIKALTLRNYRRVQAALVFLSS